MPELRVTDTEVGWDGRVYQYPPFTPSERRLIRVIAKMLFVTAYSLEWSTHNALRGDRRRGNKLARLMRATKPVEAVRDEVLVMTTDEEETA